MDNTEEKELTSNVVSIADRRLQRKEQSSGAAPKQGSGQYRLEEALISQINKLTAEVIDTRREIDSLTNTVHKLLRLLKLKRKL